MTLSNAYAIRHLRPDDEPILAEMLYFAPKPIQRHVLKHQRATTDARRRIIVSEQSPVAVKRHAGVGVSEIGIRFDDFWRAYCPA